MSRRTWRIAAALLAVAGAPAAAQQTGTDPRIAQIRAWYAEVQDALDGLQAAEREYTSGGGGGTLTLYRDGEPPRKLVVRFDGDGLSWTREYFYRDDTLFFVFVRSETFPIWPDQHPEEFGVTEERYYFAEGGLIRWLVSSHRDQMRSRTIPTSDERWLPTATALREDAATWLAFARSGETDFDAFLERQR